MKISRENYEVFILDFYEGSLSSQETEELFYFLENNPDLKEEFELFEMISIKEGSDSLHYPDKEKLKKAESNVTGEIHHSNYIENFIAYYEGDLDDDRKRELHAFLENNPELKDEFHLFSLVRLEQDTSVKFESKESLKRKVSIPFSVVAMRYAAAVSILIVIGFAAFFGLNYLQINEDGYIAFSSIRNGLSMNDSGDREKENEIQIVTPTHYYNNDLIIESKRVPENIELQALPTNHTSKLPFANLTNHFNEEKSKRNEFADIYAYRNERIQLYNPDENNYENNQEPRLFEKVVHAVRENSETASERISAISGWQIAEYGVKGFNLLTDNNIDFRVKSNDYGEVTKVALNDFAFPVKRNR